jgi:hypothetical protein
MRLKGLAEHVVIQAVLHAQREEKGEGPEAQERAVVQAE